MHLHCGQLHMALQPESGGRCDAVSWHVPGQPAAIALLQSQHEPADEVLHSACFALVPYSNRLFDGQLVTSGGPITLPRNVARLPYPVHGLGWRTAWALIGHSERHARMQYTHPGDTHWPFAHRVLQTITLSETALLWEMTLHNDAAHPMPVGQGWHPCFAIDATTQVQWQATHAWTQDDTGRPRERISAHDHGPFDFHTPRLAQDIVLNHCLDGWSGTATITRPTHGLRLRLTASALLRHLVVYRTAGKPWLCIEPVSHATGAWSLAPMQHARHGVRMLAPGAKDHGWMRLDIAQMND